MSSIFPLREKVTLDEEREPRLVEIDEDTADEVFEALSSQTTRKIFLELHQAPQTASDLADVTETSVQNVQYHLEKLLEADLVEVVDTWYSERGSEMKVYAPQDESLVLFAGRDKQRSLRSLLNRFIGVLGVLVPTSAFAGWVTSRSDSGIGGLLGGDEDADTANGDEALDAAGNGNGAATRTAGDTDGDAEEEAVAEGDAMDETADTPTAENGADANGMENGGDSVDTTSETPDLDATEQTADTFNGSDINGTDVNLTTDGGQMTPDGAFQSAAGAADSAASIDPALAAAIAFFLGGLFVFVALSMWYGTPDSWG